MARPRAGDWFEDEISGWRTEGVDVVLSLLEQEEVNELGLQQEAGLCREQGMESLLPIPDRGVPESCARPSPLLERWQERLTEAKPLRSIVELVSGVLLSSQHARSFASELIRRRHLRRSARRGA